jgi:hypothetical protein
MAPKQEKVVVRGVDKVKKVKESNKFGHEAGNNKKA